MDEKKKRTKLACDYCNKKVKECALKGSEQSATVKILAFYAFDFKFHVPLPGK